jgi:nucleoside-diphosphate-sugar epimerase
VHVSTAFVAGNRDGVVREDELLTGHGFVTPYEASKHQAERLVHDWAQRTGGRVTIYRPSVLVTDGPNRPPAAPHPIQRIGLLVSQLLNAVGPGSWPLTLRLPAALLGWLNLIQVEDAADLMVEDGLTGAASPEETARDTGGTAPDSGTAGPPVRTRHVVHQRETPFREVVTAFEQSLPVRWVLVAEPPAEPTPLEQFAEQQLSSFLPYARQSRHFAPGALAGARRLTPIDSAYVARSLRAAGIGADRAAGGPAACGPPAFRTAAAHGQ